MFSWSKLCYQNSFMYWNASNLSHFSYTHNESIIFFTLKLCTVLSKCLRFVDMQIANKWKWWGRESVMTIGWRCFLNAYAATDRSKNAFLFKLNECLSPTCLLAVSLALYSQIHMLCASTQLLYFLFIAICIWKWCHMQTSLTLRLSRTHWHDTHIFSIDWTLFDTV